MEERSLINIVAEESLKYFDKHFPTTRKLKDLKRFGQLACHLKIIAWNLSNEQEATLHSQKRVQDVSTVYKDLQDWVKISLSATDCSEALPKEVTENIHKHANEFVTGQKTKEAVMIEISLIPRCHKLAHTLCEERPNVGRSSRIPLGTSLIELPEVIKKRLLRGLKYHSSCFECPLQTTEATLERRHCTRLALRCSSEPGNSGVPIAFDVIVAAPEMERWQDTCINLQGPRQVRFAGESQREEVPHHERRVIAQKGDICKLLGDKNPVRIQFEFAGDDIVKVFGGFGVEQTPAGGTGNSLSVILKQCNLQVKDKLILAHVITVAFWQFYDTSLQHRKWTSDNIMFMPEADNSIPMKPYISIEELDAVDPQRREPFVRENLIHRYPRLLALAIILIEIGLNDSLRPVTGLTEVSQSNADWTAARNGLKQLKQASWGGFSHNHVYEEVIDSCLKSSNYDIDMKDDQDDSHIHQRRQAIYDLVVRPIQRLVETGFPGTTEQLRHFELRTHTDAKFSEAGDETGLLNDVLPSFHGTQANPRDWLSDLARIDGRILRLRNEVKKGLAKVQIPIQDTSYDYSAKCFDSINVKVAILDTGCDPSATCFDSKKKLRDNFKAWKDFTNVASEKNVDNDGHGTFMAALLSSTAPNADLHIARVVECSEDIIKGSSAIVEAIEWAALEQKVDIISMSFGFQSHHSREVRDIRNAITKAMASRESKLIIMASAGNFGPYQEEAFPASHNQVIAMRATNPMGTFHSTNPGHNTQHSIVLGTYGDTLPSWLTACNPDVCKPGSSAATAVAAGIVAFVLGHAMALAGKHGPSEHLEKMWTGEGMKRVLQKMSSDQGNGQFFINPVAFYGNLSAGSERFYHRFEDIFTTI